MRARKRQDLVERIHAAALAVGDELFLDRLLWFRAVHGLPQHHWGGYGTYRLGVLELIETSETSARSLLTELSRLASDPRARRRHSDGKPRFAGGKTLADLAAERKARDRHEGAEGPVTLGQSETNQGG